VELTTHPHLVSGLEEDRATPLLPLWAFMACCRETFTFNTTFREHKTTYIINYDNNTTYIINYDNNTTYIINYDNNTTYMINYDNNTTYIINYDNTTYIINYDNNTTFLISLAYCMSRGVNKFISLCHVSTDQRTHRRRTPSFTRRMAYSVNRFTQCPVRGYHQARRLGTNARYIHYTGARFTFGNGYRLS
jgi:hypothetical protein